MRLSAGSVADAAMVTKSRADAAAPKAAKKIVRR
jgi:hypothetical protein